MLKHRIVYIDEDESEIDIFKRSMHELFEVESMFPSEDLDDLVERLLQSHAKAFVSDFRLDEIKKYGCSVECMMAIESRFMRATQAGNEPPRSGT